MNRFAQLLHELTFVYGTIEKRRLLVAYLRQTPNPDRGWAVAALAGELEFPNFKRNLVRALTMERVDPELYEMSYRFVGETAETVSLLWPDAAQRSPTPGLGEVVDMLSIENTDTIKGHFVRLMDSLDSTQRWALIKLVTGGLRVGVSARSVKQALAAFGNQDVADIEALWHSQRPPYTALLEWLDGNGAKPEPESGPWFHPVMLANPLQEDQLDRITPDAYAAEWKYDGVRVQFVITETGSELFTRTGDAISAAFPDALGLSEEPAVLDAELLVLEDNAIASFNRLQQRLNRKRPSRAHLQNLPACLVCYDLLDLDGQSRTDRPYVERRNLLDKYVQRQSHPRLRLSPRIPFDSIEALQAHRAETGKGALRHVEGLMLKRLDSRYEIGRPRGPWYKWKRDPMQVDTVMMYAQMGHGKRSGLYSDFTFGVWSGDHLVPIGKAYFGFTDEELKRLNQWIRNNTSERFGPVREVRKDLVVELAFDAIQRSRRHKSGIALRFPRIHRIRWDKPAREADSLDRVEALLED